MSAFEITRYNPPIDFFHSFLLFLSISHSFDNFPLKMAAAKIMARIQTQQNSMVQLADLHSKQGSTLTEYTRKKDLGRGNQALASLSLLDAEV
jgi:hypothetical protein